jgi:alcohol dehydrogenase (cytochrome c)
VWLKYTVPAPGEPGGETWKGANNAWQTGGAAIWVTGTYDPDTNQTIWGTGNPVPMFDPTYRPGDNLYTNSAISWDPDTGRMNWYFQYTPGDQWDFDEAGTHILIDAPSICLRMVCTQTSPPHMKKRSLGLAALRC